MENKDLVAENEKLLRFVYQTPIAITEVDQDGNILLANAFFSQLVLPLLQGREPHNIFEVFSPFLDSMKAQFFSFEKDSGVIFQNEQVQVLQRTNEKEEYLYYNFTMIRMNRNSHMIAFSDETQRVLETEKASLLGQAMSEIFHDIRNPLSVIQGAISNSKTDNISMQDLKDMCQLVDKSSVELMSYVEDILDFVRGIKMEKVKVSLDELMQGLVEKENLMQTDVLIPVELEKTTPISFTCDPKKVERAIMNLVNNARNALKTQENKILKIIVRLESDNDSISIKVIDNGQPISEEIKSQIFDFSRKEGLGRRGLGCLIAKKIIEEHGGTIAIKTSSEGNTFDVKFPKT